MCTQSTQFKRIRNIARTCSYSRVQTRHSIISQRDFFSYWESGLGEDTFLGETSKTHVISPALVKVEKRGPHIIPFFTYIVLHLFCTLCETSAAAYLLFICA